MPRPKVRYVPSRLYRLYFYTNKSTANRHSKRTNNAADMDLPMRVAQPFGWWR
uniref:Transposase n=1 Tax=Ascaris lumbricoides TaxID=6252 RepID=A0A0M3IVY3_ASCLU